MNVYKGICASSGIGIGTSYFLEEKKEISIPCIKIQDSEKDLGWKRFEHSLNIIKSSVEKKAQCKNKELQEIAQTYLLMLNDSVFIDEIKNKYNSCSYNIEYIIYKVLNIYADKLRETNDDYFRERAFDVTDVFTKVIYQMMGFSERDLSKIPENSVIIAQTIQPSDAIEIFKQKITAIVLNEGGVNSHLAILARSHNIPLVFGIDVSMILQKHDFSGDSKIVVDANSCNVIFNASEEQIKNYTELQNKENIRKKEMIHFASKTAKTKDGEVFKLMANIGSIEEVKFAIENGADGIGLLRTEFLFMQANERDELLTENEQFEIYSEILKQMKGRPVVIRTLDAGGDKIIHIHDYKFEKEANPLLGNRAIRFCLARKDIFKTQLRALFRASSFGNLSIMIPLISTTEQFEETKKVIDEVKKELTKNFSETKLNLNVPIGIMIETPSAAICSDKLASMCDFFSIGTNDLTQYTLAVDRENLSVANLFDDLNPAVVILIKHTFESAKKHNIPISVCGELAGRTEGTKVLGGIGIRTLSMTSTKICETRHMLSNVSTSEMQSAVENLFA
ncbi:MAG: phosphoenolpyruvate--protein phosphotransferase [Treponema sp.]|nr:phosphoenolpyruvate--protein phosphotransferase [Treponema sp.]